MSWLTVMWTRMQESNECTWRAHRAAFYSSDRMNKQPKGHSRSLVRLNQRCVRNARLDCEKGALYILTGCEFTLTGLALFAAGPDVFRGMTAPTDVTPLTCNTKKTFKANYSMYWSSFGAWAISRRVSGSIPSGDVGDFFPKLPTEPRLSL